MHRAYCCDQANLTITCFGYMHSEMRADSHDPCLCWQASMVFFADTPVRVRKSGWKARFTFYHTYEGRRAICMQFPALSPMQHFICMHLRVQDCYKECRIPLSGACCACKLRSCLRACMHTLTAWLTRCIMIYGWEDALWVASCWLGASFAGDMLPWTIS